MINIHYLLYRIRLKATYEIKKYSRRPFSSLIFPFSITDQPPVIIHFCYHKVGTVWFGRILREIAAEFGLSFGSGDNYQQINNFENFQDFQIFIDNGSHVKVDKLPNYIGSHMIRDPRDMIISGYFYHLWTNEQWANLPKAHYRGRSYREYLNSIDQDKGLVAEIHRNWFWIPHMAGWNYNNSKIFEIKYEDIIIDEEAILYKMFEHYGFKPNAVKRCCSIASKHSFKTLTKYKGTGSKSHLRSGKCGEWKQYFKKEHKDLFKTMYPDALVKLGYEKDDNW
jgi:Sulfotransferase domain